VTDSVDCPFCGRTNYIELCDIGGDTELEQECDNEDCCEMFNVTVDYEPYLTASKPAEEAPHETK
jgi:hypothetical protein